MRLGPRTVPECGAELNDIVWHPSPNFSPRRDGLRPELIVIHYTAMRSADDALHRLCDAGAEVSAHYLIAGDGRIWQLIEEDMRAWHAGAGAWRGRGDVNSRSIGIELDNRGTHPFSEPQMAALEDLVAGVMKRWDIAPEGVIGHSDMAPGRKCDPGPRFDWARLARQGLAAQPDMAGIADGEQDFLTLAGAAGYPTELDETTLLQAIRLRYRPWARGPLSAEDVAVLAGVVRGIV